jgi:hypothetical protein
MTNIFRCLIDRSNFRVRVITKNKVALIIGHTKLNAELTE